MSFATTDGGTQLVQGIPKDAFIGHRALNVQSYIESNVKNGSQFEVAAQVASLAAAANNDVIFITGSKPVIVKARIVQFNGLLLEAHVYRSPTYSGGSNASIYNLNDINPQTGEVIIKTGATVTATGTEFGAPTYAIGSSGQGQSSFSTFTVLGQERILRANTTYLLRITNTDTSAQRVAAYLSWHEGAPDLPLAAGLI